MQETDRIKLLIKWLISEGFGKNQEDIGRLLGYSNKSSFSQVLNGKKPLNSNFIAKLKDLKPSINESWLTLGVGEMFLKTNDETNLEESDKFYEVKERLRLLRTNLKISQEDFAKSIGLKQGSYSDIERGKTKNISGSVLNLIENLYNIRPEWLLTGEGEMLKKTYEATESTSLKTAEPDLSYQRDSINNLITKTEKGMETISMLLRRVEELSRENERLRLENETFRSQLEINEKKTGNVS